MEEAAVRESDELSAYIPRNIDVRCCLESEAKCCFIMSRVLRGAVVCTDVCAAAITAASATQVNGHPKLAIGLAVGGTLSSLLSMGSSLFLMKINAKLMQLDKALEKIRPEPGQI
jgi:sensor c-di-GMP phosphodiesterase-like protein